VRQIWNVLSSSSRGKKRRQDELRSGAGRHSLLPPPHRRMVCGGGPGPPLPLRHQPARPRGQRAPHRRAHHGHYSLVEVQVPPGVRVNRQGIRQQRQVAPPLHLGRLKNQRSRRPRKTSGSPRDCGANTITVLILSHPFLFSSAIYRLCMHYFFQGTAISAVCLSTRVRFI